MTDTKDKVVDLIGLTLFCWLIFSFVLFFVIGASAIIAGFIIAIGLDIIIVIMYEFVWHNWNGVARQLPWRK